MSVLAERETMMQLSEQLLHTTIRLEAVIPGGLSVGTGFFFNFCEEGSSHVPVIVTNKHVVKGASTIRVLFSRVGPDGGLLDEQEPLEIRNPQGHWIDHPNPSVDLCVLPIAPALEGFNRAGKPLFTMPLGLDLLPTPEQIESFGCMDEVTMIGYPNGLWDDRNNLPIVRRGITATPYKYDYRGRKEFLVDMACYPGSSGSPVFLYNEGAYAVGGGINVGTRLILLGVQYAVPVRDVQGDVVVTGDIHAHMKDMLNLGYVIKSERLRAFEPMLRAMI